MEDALEELVGEIEDEFDVEFRPAALLAAVEVAVGMDGRAGAVRPPAATTSSAPATARSTAASLRSRTKEWRPALPRLRDVSELRLHRIGNPTGCRSTR